MTPESLAQVASSAREGQSFDFVLRSFLDQFRADPRQAALDPQPAPLAGLSAMGEVYDAYLAATAEALAVEFQLAVPAWAWHACRTLRRPWFALPWSGVRGILLLESPAAFRSRNLFVSANALTRA